DALLNSDRAGYRLWISRSKRLEHPQSVTRPSHHPYPTPLGTPPERVPIQGLVADILHALALLQSGPNCTGTFRLFARRDKSKGRYRLVIMNSVVCEGQSQIHDDQ